MGTNYPLKRIPFDRPSPIRAANGVERSVHDVASRLLQPLPQRRTDMSINRTAGAPNSLSLRRRADRRAGVHELIRDVVQDWIGSRGHLDVQNSLVARLRRILPAQTVRVNEVSGSTLLRVGQPVRAKDYAAFAIPLSDTRRHLVLEASFHSGDTVDDWTCQFLETAASLATLILEAERLSRLQHPHGRGAQDEAAPLIGSSLVMLGLRERIDRVATTDFTILIEGESGTGKELVAKQIHALSRRRQGPFVAINCAALVETLIEAELFGIEERTATGVRGRRGKFEHADGGTLFLDEISELSLAAQAKLLRAIQDLTVERVGGNGSRRIDTRIVAATNRSLDQLVERGLFRSDLFYRLSGVEVQVPPLRRRKEDIFELADYFLSCHSGGGRQRKTMSRAAIDVLMAYDWPGNVRELERMIEGAIATCDAQEIGIDDLPISLRGTYGEILMPAFQTSDTLRAWGSRYARLVYEKCGHNKRRACELLDISYHTLNGYLRYRQRPGDTSSVTNGTVAVEARTERRVDG
jgi:DNA-binding NtrC family response regulator